MKVKKSHACGKNRYETQGAAIRVAINASKKRGIALRVYGCPTCHGWHLTHRRFKPQAAVPETELQSLNLFGHYEWCRCSRCAWLDEHTVASA